MRAWYWTQRVIVGVSVVATGVVLGLDGWKLYAFVSTMTLALYATETLSRIERP